MQISEIHMSIIIIFTKINNHGKDFQEEQAQITFG
jgi:hypothetical protein